MRKAGTNLISIEGFGIPPTNGPVVGRVTGFDEEGHPIVDYEGNPFGPVRARYVSSVDLEGSDGQGLPVLLVFGNGDGRRPIVIGAVREVINRSETVHLDPPEPKEIVCDGKKMVVEAREKIELRCGKSSVILTKEGKIVIKGIEIVSRAARTNKIKGASVSIN